MIALKYMSMLFVICLIALTCEASPQYFGRFGGRGFGHGIGHGFGHNRFGNSYGGGFRSAGFGRPRFFGGFGGFSNEGFGRNSFEFFG